MTLCEDQQVEWGLKELARFIVRYSFSTGSITFKIIYIKYLVDAIECL